MIEKEINSLDLHLNLFFFFYETRRMSLIRNSILLNYHKPKTSVLKC